MEESPKPLRAAGRKVPGKGAAGKTKAVAVDEVAYSQVHAQAKKLKMSKSTYASAAIAYFAESGLNPTAERPQGLAGVALKVGAEARSVRVQQVEIGNRLITMQRAWEKNLYGFLQQQQMSLNTYLELIESNILQHQVTVETNLLAPMVENLFKATLEAFITRGIAAKLYVNATNKPPGAYPDMIREMNGDRDEQLALLMREFLKTNAVGLPKPTAKRAITPVPSKPVVPATPAPAEPAQP